MTSKTTGILFRAVLATSILLVGCAGRPENKAPNIHYGQDPCSECRMIIGDKRFAAAFISEDGEVFKFDDIGCMRTYEEKNKVLPKNSWVHDYQSEQWVVKEQAIFVFSKQLVTPMGYEIAAFSDAGAAKEFLGKGGGQKISWDEISETLQHDVNESRGIKW